MLCIHLIPGHVVENVEMLASEIVLTLLCFTSNVAYNFHSPYSSLGLGLERTIALVTASETKKTSRQL